MKVTTTRLQNHHRSTPILRRHRPRRNIKHPLRLQSPANSAPTAAPPRSTSSPKPSAAPTKTAPTTSATPTSPSSPSKNWPTPRYAAAWRASIDPTKPTPSKDLVRPAGFVPPAPAIPAPSESTQTTHFSIVDADGNAVANTYTLNGLFGSGVTVEGLGFVLNNEMDDFASKLGVPNTYGLIQGPANSIAPGKRPLSAMTPTIVTRNGKLVMVLGSPGGATIITTVANDLISTLDNGLNVQQAADAPRFHHQYLPDRLDLEKQFDPP